MMMSDNPIKTLWDNDRAMREIESLRQQLADCRNQLTMLRDALEFIPESGSMLGHAAEMKRKAALAATEPKK